MYLYKLINKLKIMNGFEYFKNCISNDYANFNGRARRSEFWYFTLFNLLTIILIYIFSNLIFGEEFASILNILISLLLFTPTIAVTIRRLHDVNLSGWFIAIQVIPFGGLFLLIKFCQDGDRHTNKYGTDPKGRSLEFEFETIHNQKI